MSQAFFNALERLPKAPVCVECREINPAMFYEASKSRCVHCYRARQAKLYKARKAADPSKIRARWVADGKARRGSVRVKARDAVRAAVKSGRLGKPKHCELCGLERPLSGHHEDYSKPLCVIFLCAVCHGKEHRRLGWK